MSIKSSQYLSHASKKRLIFMFTSMIFILPGVVEASFNGPMHFDFRTFFILAAAFALPGALISLVIEWLSAKHRPPQVIGLMAMAVVLYCIASTVNFNSRSGHQFFIIFIPPLIALALAAFVIRPSLRIKVALSIAILSPIIGFFGLQSTPWKNNELLGVLLGGAVVSTLLWLAGHYLGRKSIKRELDNNGR